MIFQEFLRPWYEPQVYVHICALEIRDSHREVGKEAKVVRMRPSEEGGNKTDVAVTYHRSPHYNKPQNLGITPHRRSANRAHGCRLNLEKGRYSREGQWSPCGEV